MPVRRAGHGTASSGRTVWWSIADGRRGRRWREALVERGAIAHSLLFETDPERRFSHLELATSAGLLTLHPEPDGTLHGNALLADGLRHVIGLAWDMDGLVLIDGSVVSVTAAAFLLDRLQPPGETPMGFSTSHPALHIRTDLVLERTQIDVERSVGGVWEIADVGAIETLEDGVPSLADAMSWPLEVDASQ